MTFRRAHTCSFWIAAALAPCLLGLGVASAGPCSPVAAAQGPAKVASFSTPVAHASASTTVRIPRSVGADVARSRKAARAATAGTASCLTGSSKDMLAGAWKYTRGLDRAGRPVVVAVVDSGVDMRHPGLRNAMWTNPGEIAGNGVDDDGNGYVDDVHGANVVDPGAEMGDPCGHGTRVAGVIAARPGGADGGAVGVAYESQIMAVRVLDAAGRGNTAQLAEGIRYAVSNGAQVINISANTPAEGPDLLSAMAFADAQGVVVVASAGNDGRNLDVLPSFPASDASAGVVSVAALGTAGGLASFSNFGPLSVDVAAPGVGLVTLAPGGHYSLFDGTSAAAAYVSGAAALVLAASDGASPDRIRDVLMGSARDRDPSQLGSGSVAVDRAVAAVAAAEHSSPVVSLHMVRSAATASRSVRVRLVVSAPVKEATTCRVIVHGATLRLDMEPGGKPGMLGSVGTLRTTLPRGIQRLSAVVSCKGDDGARVTNTTISLHR